jgi:hypothetical protein
MNFWTGYYGAWLLAFMVPEVYWIINGPYNTLSENYWRLEGLDRARPFDFAMWTDVHWAMAGVVWLLFLWLSLHLPFGLLS